MKNKKSDIKGKQKREKSNREKLLLKSVGSIPLVSASVPLVSREIPLVSGYLPLVSSRPAITIPRSWGLMPSRYWGKTRLPVRRKRELGPTDIGLFKFLGKVVTAPWQPVVMVKGMAERVKEIAEEEEKKESRWL